MALWQEILWSVGTILVAKLLMGIIVKKAYSLGVLWSKTGRRLFMRFGFTTRHYERFETRVEEANMSFWAGANADDGDRAVKIAKKARKGGKQARRKLMERLNINDPRRE